MSMQDVKGDVESADNGIAPGHQQSMRTCLAMMKIAQWARVRQSKLEARKWFRSRFRFRAKDRRFL